ncbi:hypothetical protein L1049_022197 [Liquidambar formosana]|uniref:Uncharacterized protein n=1 Tax=Liquidambar formosana TaxID=63359 RepID=A0AAP0RC70_LIQFO
MSVAAEEREVEAGTIAEVKNAAVEDIEAEAGNIGVDSNVTASKSEVLEGGVLNSCPTASLDLEPPSLLIEKKALLLEKDASIPEEKVAEVEVDENSHDLPNVDISVKPSPAEGEKQDEAETGKESTKKLSAAAPPFNPSTIPVFGTVSMPGFKDHGGILPPPVNIAPMLTVNPVRRSPHQSATARVPYGPRLSGGYNRSGNRVQRNKPGFHNNEHTGDGNQYSPPRIMNPHAAEFVPGQPWIPNGYTVSPNGLLVSPNGIPVSPNGYPISPNGIPVSPNGFSGSLNGIPVSQNGFPASPVSSVESPTAVSVEVDVENKSEVVAEESTEKSSIVAEEITAKSLIVAEENTEKSSIEVGAENQPIKQQAQEDQTGDDEKNSSEIEAKPTGTVEASGDIVMAKENCKNIVVEEKQTKCWGDYSDSESEIVEVTN